MKNILREYIRELLATFLAEKNIVSEPDENLGNPKLEISTLGGMAITGTTSPATPDNDDEEDDAVARSFGGGRYKE